MASRVKIPRIVVAALRGGAGKTLITVGLIREMHRSGMSVAAFKKGPDYIDAGWLGLAARTQCHNLDSYLTGPDQARQTFIERSVGRDIAVVEGSRGIFDGVDAQGSFSTAELAKLIAAPTIIVVDATKVTRTAAAFILGCKLLDPDLRVSAVILNRIAGTRHENVVRDAIEQACAVPVIGAIPKLPLSDFPQRHLGLIPLYEHPRAEEFAEAAADILAKYVDVESVRDLARTAPDLTVEPPSEHVPHNELRHFGLRIGVIKDSSFQFYYPENLEALQAAGAALIVLNALEPNELPPLDALYIGGGFPETHAERLAQNAIFKNSLSQAIQSGLPVYAECGGLMYLARRLQVDDKTYPMVGVFPLDVTLHRKPQGHGYVKVEIVRPNPFYPVGTVITGHEFHYSSVSDVEDGDRAYCCFEVRRGHGFDGSKDGVCMYNCLGTYVHVHALGTPSWAEGILESAARFAKSRGMPPGAHR
ncbi:MAG: cobyrinate a,c-diamide synthase [Desulfomonilaceae bacterium]